MNNPSPLQLSVPQLVSNFIQPVGTVVKPKPVIVGSQSFRSEMAQRMLMRYPTQVLVRSE